MEVIKCALKYILEPSTLKPVFSAVPLSCAQVSGRDQLLDGAAGLTEAFLGQLQNSISYVW